MDTTINVNGSEFNLVELGAGEFRLDQGGQEIGRVLSCVQGEVRGSGRHCYTVDVPAFFAFNGTSEDYVAPTAEAAAVAFIEAVVTAPDAPVFDLFSGRRVA